MTRLASQGHGWVCVSAAGSLLAGHADDKAWQCSRQATSCLTALLLQVRCWCFCGRAVPGRRERCSLPHLAAGRYQESWSPRACHSSARSHAGRVYRRRQGSPHRIMSWVPCQQPPPGVRIVRTGAAAGSDKPWGRSATCRFLPGAVEALLGSAWCWPLLHWGRPEAALHGVLFGTMSLSLGWELTPPPSLHEVTCCVVR